jgi:hypothetical protein
MKKGLKYLILLTFFNFTCRKGLFLGHEEHSMSFFDSIYNPFSIILQPEIGLSGRDRTVPGR